MRPLLAALPVLLLAGCASLTPYQPLREGYGYSEQVIEANRLRVSFAGSSKTPRQTVENYLLYRAAEVTLARGYDYFVMTRSFTEARSDAGAEPTVSLGFGGFNFGSHGGVGLGVGTTTGGGRGAAYTAQADLLLLKGAKPPNDAQAYDAREVRGSLEAQIQRRSGP